MKVKESKIMEIVGCKLSGIEGVTLTEASKMKRACAKAVYEYHEKEMARLQKEIDELAQMIYG